jgi:hypothetical protein
LSVGLAQRSRLVDRVPRRLRQRGRILADASTRRHFHEQLDVEQQREHGRESVRQQRELEELVEQRPETAKVQAQHRRGRIRGNVAVPRQGLLRRHDTTPRGHTDHWHRGVRADEGQHRDYENDRR